MKGDVVISVSNGSEKELFSLPPYLCLDTSQLDELPTNFEDSKLFSLHADTTFFQRTIKLGIFDRIHHDIHNMNRASTEKGQVAVSMIAEDVDSAEVS